MTEGLPNDPLGIRRLRDRRQRFRERARAEYITGAEEEWRGRMGRPMTAEELERVVRPGRVAAGGALATVRGCT